MDASHYGKQALSVLAEIWQAAGYPWSVRLKALLPSRLPWIRKRYRLNPETERQFRDRIHVGHHEGCQPGRNVSSFAEQVGIGLEVSSSQF